MRILVLVALLLCSQLARGAEPINPAGLYSTVSESEWEMKLKLTKKHKAKLDIYSWEPGEGDHPNVTTLSGTWRLVSDQIEISFPKGTVAFAFNPALSFDDFDKKGSAQGLVGTSASFDANNYVGRHFWLQSELDKIKW